MIFTIRHNFLLIGFILIFLTGCAAYNTQKVGPTTMLKAQEEIPEDHLLDVGIQVFESEEITEEEAKEEHTSP